MTKTAIFENSKWRTAAILKIALSAYLSRELSNFDLVWYIDTNFHSEHANLTKQSTFLKFKMADGRHIECRFWLFLGDLLADQHEIRKGDEESHANTGHVRDQNCNFPKFKMADARHFENSFISISQSRIIRFRSNFVCRCKFPFRGWLFDKNRIFSNSRWRTDAILKIVFWLYLGTLLAD